MQSAYIAATLLAALANAVAAGMNFAGAEYVKDVARTVHVSQRWMIPFGTLLAAGATGLLLGLAVQPVGIAAAIGLVAYFVCALGAHARVRDPNVGGAVTFLVLAAAALTTSLAERGA